MGWWDAGVMCGDSPLDWFGDFCSIAVPGKYNGCNDEILTREAVNKALPDIVDAIEESVAKENLVFDRYAKPGMRHLCVGDAETIGFQVLGVVIMERGADMPDDVRAKIIEAATKDEWARETGSESDRSQNMAAFIEKVRAYQPGTPVDCEREHGKCLMAKFAEVLGGGA